MALYIRCDECLKPINPKVDDYLSLEHHFGYMTLLNGSVLDIQLCENCLNFYFEKFIK